MAISEREEEKVIGYEGKKARRWWCGAKRKGGWKCHWSNRSLHKLNEERSGRRLGATQRLKMLTRELKIARERHRGEQAELTGTLESSRDTYATYFLRLTLLNLCPLCSCCHFIAVCMDF